VRSEEEGGGREKEEECKKEYRGGTFLTKKFLPEPLFKKLYKCSTLLIAAV
jgi:hypothetical protein